MEERIREIMKCEDFTPARFADTLDISRAIISHVLNGRNNPSLDLVSRILEAFPNVNPDWLIFGAGNMYRDDANTSHATHNKPETVTDYGSQDLFSQPDLSAPVAIEKKLDQQKSEVPQIPKETIETSVRHSDSTGDGNSERIIYKSTTPKKITQIIIYFDDNTYEVFNH